MILPLSLLKPVFDHLRQPGQSFWMGSSSLKPSGRKKQAKNTLVAMATLALKMFSEIPAQRTLCESVNMSISHPKGVL